MERTVPRMALLGLICALATTMARADSPDSRTAAGDLEDIPAAAHMPDDPWSSPDIVAPRMDPLPRPLPRRMDSDAGGVPGAQLSDRRGSSWVRTTAALGGVVALIALLTWGYRAAAAGRLGLSPHGRNPALIEVVGRTALSPRQSLCLVRIGPRLVLLGVTSDAVRSLDVIDDADLAARLLGQAALRRPDSSSAEFAKCLEREGRSYGAADESPDEILTPEAERIISTKEKLAGTIKRLRATAV